MDNFKIISKEDYLKTNKLPKQEQIWNNIAKPWKTYRSNKIQIVEEFLENKKGKIIDLGCGAGRNMIPSPKIDYYGVDFSEEQIRQAKKYIKNNNINAKLFKSKLNKLPEEFKNKMFDYGLFMASLHCIETKEERLSALKELHRILKPNSEALISVWNSEDKRFDSVNNSGDIYMSWRENNIPYMRYYYLYKKEEITKLLNFAGFEILQIYEPREKDRFSRKNWIFRVKKSN